MTCQCASAEECCEVFIPAAIGDDCAYCGHQHTCHRNALTPTDQRTEPA